MKLTKTAGDAILFTNKTVCLGISTTRTHRPGITCVEGKVSRLADLRPRAANPLGFLAAFFDRLGRYEPAATIAGFAATRPLALPVMAEFGTAIAHLSDVFGEATTNRSPGRVRR